MTGLEKFEFERSRGVVWVCDLASSSKYLNDNQTADELEEFLPRLYWIASNIVDAAGGKFIKWTGDGFLAWFETSLHRGLGEKANAAFVAAWYLTSIINVTQLGLNPKRKFKIRHGITYEQDALIIKIHQTGNFESLDLIGRAVVLAFRLSGISTDFPNIVTQKDLVSASSDYQKLICNFTKWQANTNDKYKYFKGERWGTESIYISSEKKIKKSVSLKSTLRKAKRDIDFAEGRATPENSNIEFINRFLINIQSSPDWCHTVINEYIRFLQEDLFGTLKKGISLLEQKIEANPKQKDNKIK
jgi:class 3 adenylate cyclase